MSACTNCCLNKSSDIADYGVPPAPILFLGDGPSRNDELLGKTFSDTSGMLLDDIVTQTGYSGNWCASNIVHCRPTDRTGGEQRDPHPAEVLACMPRVLLRLKLYDPHVVVLLGTVAWRYYERLLAHPRIHLIHPSAILRAGGRAAPGFTRSVIQLRKFLTQEGLI